MDDSALERVESKRKELEATIARLRKSLRHWQTVELDYEGLREEFARLDADASEDKCLEVARDFKAETLDENDLKVLMRDAIKQPSRRPQQLAHLLSKRVEYVARNVETVRKQLQNEQKNLNVILLAEDPSTQDVAGLPLGEIVEELDDSGRVISAKVEHPGARSAELADVLEKAGVEGLKEKDGMLTVVESASAPPKAQKREEEKAVSGSAEQQNTASETVQEVEPTPSTLSPEPATEPATQTATVDQDMDSDASSVPEFPGNPADTEEEANLRREMINYNLDTMNAIVAELDLAEDASDVSYDDDPDHANLVPDSDLDDFDMDDEDEEGESEDETGASKHLRLNAKYQEQMEELQKKLGLSGLKNVGPNAGLADDVKREIDRLRGTRPPAAEAARNAAIQRATAPTEEHKPKVAAKAEKKTKKKVAFSEVLDIADETGPSKADAKKSQPPSRAKAGQAVATPPINETVLERADTSSSATPPAPPKPRMSQFKQRKRAALSSTTTTTDFVPTPPQDSLVADTVLERPSVPTFSPPDPYAIDDEAHRRQVALEYHRLKSRNKIQPQSSDRLRGGDDEDDDDDDWYTKDEDTGAVKKVSRFKAARLQLA